MNQLVSPRSAKTPQPTSWGHGSNYFVVWTLLALMLTLCVAQAAGPDEDYATILGTISTADNLNQHGNITQAHAKYLQAWQELSELHRTNPDWKNDIVTYRLNSLAKKFAATGEQAAASTSTNTTGTTTTGSVTKTTKVQVKVLDAGGEPRTALRLHPSAGDQQTLTMTMKMDMDMVVAGKSTPAVNIPPMAMTMVVNVTSVAPNGDISYKVTYDDITLATDTNTLPAMATAIKSALAGIKGMSGTGKLSSHGIHLGMQMKLPPNANPQMIQIMDQMKDSFSSSALPLPEEAVGVGAKWEYKTKLKSQGMTIDQTITSELVSIDGDHATLRNTIQQSAANQKVQNPAMPGLKVDLAKLTGTGTGTSTLDLSHLLPVSATLDEKTETSMAINMGQQKQNMNMKMNINITLESK